MTYTQMQQSLIQNFNQWLTANNTLQNNGASVAARVEADSKITGYFNSLIDSLSCIFDYLNSHPTIPQQDYEQLRNTYYNVVVPMRKQIEINRNEVQNLNGQGNVEDHRYEIEKQNYNATVYIYIMLTVLATVLLYYVLLNIVRK